MKPEELKGLVKAYASIYTNLSESHYKVGDKVTCKESGMTGKVVEVDPEEKGKYYTVDREDGKKVKYAPEELKKNNGGVSKKEEEKFHTKLDKLVHKSFGKSPEEQKEEVEYFTEEVEIATEYFYNLGLNEEGLEMVIEDLGLDEFTEWIDDIMVEYTLTEATKTRLQQRGPLKSKKGVKAQSTTTARVKKQGGTTMSTDSAPKSVMRKSAVAKAKKSQGSSEKEAPAETKKGLFSAISSGMKRHREATQTAKRLAGETGTTLNKLRKGLGQAWQTASDSKLAQAGRVGIKKGLKRQQKAIDTLAPMAGKAAGRAAAGLVNSLKKEEYDALLSHILEEGYAANEEAATIIIENMSEEWMSIILEAHPLDRQRLAIQQKRRIPTFNFLKPKPKKKSVGS